MANEVLEDEGNAREWLHRTQIGFGARIPLDMIISFAPQLQGIDNLKE
ncbi:MAG TPA: hypothetical protein DHV16_00635 [Nitrospiraceae bacterium]|nr:hypothetical protein [Nitrospiraceae bacterium]